MATAALLNPVPLCSSFPSSTLAVSVFQPNSITMHMTRPKSAKGRTRSAFNYSGTAGTSPCAVPSSPAAPRDLQSSQRAPAMKAVFPSGHISPGEIPELLQQVPLRSSSSLNKYRVLPSIGRKDVEGAAEQSSPMGVMGASCGQENAPKTAAPSGEQRSACRAPESHVHNEETSCAPEKPGRKMRQESPLLSTLSLEEPLQKESCLLLAIRSPSGQRFEHHFKPTDSLQTVVAIAEHQTATKYECCSIETTEVPRRSFRDLSRSLQECGIPHMSVLCIRQAEQQDTDL
ncbi:UBX domain-containing protein 10 [Coturnix japonica]|uniref:UBX domain-containing protein 10 n=1 Tax=Coturnix japonica TaxID=93934 RepID=UPI000777DEAF|nr:UBX domain-containing protein 10 [Coturnix japonica]XP_032304563.1 UBX domain-containing protein 10 [Coturnix japonica]